MRAVIFEGAGGPEVITIGEVPNPEVRPEHIRVRVHAAGVNRADLIQRQGHYPAPPGWPANIPGLEYAGEVEAIRSGVTRWRVGDRVMGLFHGGVGPTDRAPAPGENGSGDWGSCPVPAQITRPGAGVKMAVPKGTPMSKPGCPILQLEGLTGLGHQSRQ